MVALDILRNKLMKEVNAAKILKKISFSNTVSKEEIEGKDENLSENN
jgi:hypothetical protein